MSSREVVQDPMPYLPQDRRMDVKHGRRDGRKQIPTYTDLVALDENEARITTPYQEQLVHAGLVRINEEYERFLDRTAGLRHQLARLRGQLVSDEEEVRRGFEDLEAAKAPLTETEMLPRNHQELGLGEPELRSRRELMRERRIALATGELQRRLGNSDQRRQEITALCGRIDHEFAAAQATGRRLGDYFVLRAATYWEALAQAHPEGRHLAARIPAITSTLPDWVDGTSEGGVITLAPEGRPE